VGVARADFDAHAVFRLIQRARVLLVGRGTLPCIDLAFFTVGALVASYRPENTIGWIFLSGAFVWIVGELTLEYGVYVLITDPGALPAGL
jgi:hypothetical protein